MSSTTQTPVFCCVDNCDMTAAFNGDNPLPVTSDYAGDFDELEGKFAVIYADERVASPGQFYSIVESITARKTHQNVKLDDNIPTGPKWARRWRCTHVRGLQRHVDDADQQQGAGRAERTASSSRPHDGLAAGGDTASLGAVEGEPGGRLRRGPAAASPPQLTLVLATRAARRTPSSLHPHCCNCSALYRCSLSHATHNMHTHSLLFL